MALRPPKLSAAQPIPSAHSEFKAPPFLARRRPGLPLRQAAASLEEPKSVAIDTASSVHFRRTEMEPHQFIPFEAIEFGRRIGMGSFAKVFKADFTYGADRKKAPSAVKFYAPASIPEGKAAQDARVSQVKRELAVLTRIPVGHPNLVGFYGAGFHVPEKRFYLVLEHLSKGSLEEYLKTMPQGLSWAIFLKIAIGMAAGLVDLQKWGFIHGDIKPSNVLLDGDQFEQVKLTDFGMTIKARDSKYAKITDTPYLAPEVMTGKASKASDVYSFGVVLLHMLDPVAFAKCVGVVGAKLFPELWKENIPKNIGLLTCLLKHAKCSGATPTEREDFINNVVLKCVDVDPAKRPKMSAVLDKLNQLQKACLQRVDDVKAAPALASQGRFKPSVKSNAQQPKLEPVRIGFGCFG